MVLGWVGRHQGDGQKPGRGCRVLGVQLSWEVWGELSRRVLATHLWDHWNYALETKIEITEVLPR